MLLTESHLWTLRGKYNTYSSRYTQHCRWNVQWHRNCGWRLGWGNKAISNIPTHTLTLPAFLHLGIYPEGSPPTIWKYICPKLLTEGKFLIANYQELPKHPNIRDWLNKLLYRHSMEYYADVQENKKSPNEVIQRFLRGTTKWKKKCKEHIEYAIFYVRKKNLICLSL